MEPRETDSNRPTDEAESWLRRVLYPALKVEMNEYGAAWLGMLAFYVLPYLMAAVGYQYSTSVERQFQELGTTLAVFTLQSIIVLRWLRVSLRVGLAVSRSSHFVGIALSAGVAFYSFRYVVPQLLAFANQTVGDIAMMLLMMFVGAKPPFRP